MLEVPGASVSRKIRVLNCASVREGYFDLCFVDMIDDDGCDGCDAGGSDDPVMQHDSQ